MIPSHQNIVLLLQDHDRPTPNTKLSDIIALLDTQANHTDVVLPESRSRRSRSLHASLSSSYRKFLWETITYLGKFTRCAVAVRSPIGHGMIRLVWFA